jgi:hypothetical protein
MSEKEKLSGRPKNILSQKISLRLRSALKKSAYRDVRDNSLIELLNLQPLGRLRGQAGANKTPLRF